MSNLVLMQGNQACVEGAIKAGMKFFAGYPISPASEIAEISSVKLPEVSGRFIQMEDEIASIAAVVGASLTGKKSMTATSGPGFSLKQEVLGYASMAEVPCVIVNVMRGGPSTGMPTSVSQGDVMQSKWGTHGDHPVIVIAPDSVASTYELTITAFNYAEKYRVPVILLLDEVIAHMRESVYIEEDFHVIDRSVPDKKQGFLPYKFTSNLVPPMAPIGEGYKFHVTGLSHDEEGYPSNSKVEGEKLLDRLLNKIEKNRDEIVLYEEMNTKDCSHLIVAFGSTARVCAELVLNKSLTEFGLFLPFTIWPFPERRLMEIIEKNHIDKIYVAELNAGQLIIEIKRIVGPKCEVIGINKYSGEIFEPNEIEDVIRRDEK